MIAAKKLDPVDELTTAEAGVLLKTSRRQVLRWCEEGFLTGAYQRGVGKHWRIPRAAVLAIQARWRGC